MLAADDPQWSTLTGGYRMPLDPRPLIRKLEDNQDVEATWRELWDELHHQGDVGDASYVAVPLIVDVVTKQGDADWNAFAIVAIIEFARGRGRNPEVPGWLSEEYFAAIQRLAQIGLREVAEVRDTETVRAILSVIALAKGLRMHA